MSLAGKKEFYGLLFSFPPFQRRRRRRRIGELGIHQLQVNPSTHICLWQQWIINLEKFLKIKSWLRWKSCSVTFYQEFFTYLFKKGQPWLHSAYFCLFIVQYRKLVASMSICAKKFKTAYILDAVWWKIEFWMLQALEALKNLIFPLVKIMWCFNHKVSFLW